MACAKKLNKAKKNKQSRFIAYSTNNNKAALWMWIITWYLTGLRNRNSQVRMTGLPVI